MKNLILSFAFLSVSASAAEVVLPKLYCVILPQVEITYNGKIGHVKRGAPGGKPWVNEDLIVVDKDGIRTMTGKSVTISLSLAATDTYEYKGKTLHNYWISTTSTKAYNDANEGRAIEASQTCHDYKPSKEDGWENFKN
jgi:hypothetical protein